jgi:magnesium chelatase family protein
MLAKVYSTSLVGLEAREIQIEVESNLGIPHHVMLGLPDAAVKESKQRIESAINNSGFEFPVDRKLTINLAPADIKKEGPVFDLPIALGALASFALIPTRGFSKSADLR